MKDKFSRLAFQYHIKTSLIKYPIIHDIGSLTSFQKNVGLDPVGTFDPSSILQVKMTCLLIEVNAKDSKLIHHYLL